MKFIKTFESYDGLDFLEPSEIKPGMQCDISYDNLHKISASTSQFVKSYYTAEVIDIFKGSELFNLATKAKAYFYNKTDKTPKDRREFIKLTTYTYAKDSIDTISGKISDYKDKYFLLINIIEIDSLKVVVYGKDDFNFTTDRSFFIPRWKLQNREKLNDINKKTGLFDE